MAGLLEDKLKKPYKAKPKINLHSPVTVNHNHFPSVIRYRSQAKYNLGSTSIRDKTPAESPSSEIDRRKLSIQTDCLIKYGFTRSEERRRLFSATTIGTKTLLEDTQAKPIIVNGFVIPTKICKSLDYEEKDLPRVIRLQSVQIAEMLEQMHEKFKVLLNKVDRTRRNIEELNI